MRRATQRKYTGDIRTPLELEGSVKELLPTNEQEHKDLIEIVKTLEQSGNLSGGEKKALTIWKTNLLADTIKPHVQKRFVHDFWAWLLGRGRPEDIKNTPWGAQKLTDDPEVRAYVDLFVDKNFEYRAKLQKMAMRRPWGIQECYLYYKYLVRDGKKEGNVFDVEFLKDWQEFGKDFDEARKKGQEAFNPASHKYDMAPYGDMARKMGKKYDEDHALPPQFRDSAGAARPPPAPGAPGGPPAPGGAPPPPRGTEAPPDPGFQDGEDGPAPGLDEALRTLSSRTEALRGESKKSRSVRKEAAPTPVQVSPGHQGPPPPWPSPPSAPIRVQVPLGQQGPPNLDNPFIAQQEGRRIQEERNKALIEQENRLRAELRVQEEKLKEATRTQSLSQKELAEAQARISELEARQQEISESTRIFREREAHMQKLTGQFQAALKQRDADLQRAISNANDLHSKNRAMASFMEEIRNQMEALRTGHVSDVEGYKQRITKLQEEVRQITGAQRGKQPIEQDQADFVALKNVEMQTRFAEQLAEQKGDFERAFEALKKSAEEERGRQLEEIQRLNTEISKIATNPEKVAERLDGELKAAPVPVRQSVRATMPQLAATMELIEETTIRTAPTTVPSTVKTKEESAEEMVQRRGNLLITVENVVEDISETKAKRQSRLNKGAAKIASATQKIAERSLAVEQVARDAIASTAISEANPADESARKEASQLQSLVGVLAEGIQQEEKLVVDMGKRERDDAEQIQQFDKDDLKRALKTIRYAIKGDELDQAEMIAAYEAYEDEQQQRKRQLEREKARLLSEQQQAEEYLARQQQELSELAAQQEELDREVAALAEQEQAAQLEAEKAAMEKAAMEKAALEKQATAQEEAEKAALDEQIREYQERMLKQQAKFAAIKAEAEKARARRAPEQLASVQKAAKDAEALAQARREEVEKVTAQEADVDANIVELAEAKTIIKKRTNRELRLALEMQQQLQAPGPRSRKPIGYYKGMSGGTSKRETSYKLMSAAQTAPMGGGGGGGATSATVASGYGRSEGVELKPRVTKKAAVAEPATVEVPLHVPSIKEKPAIAVAREEEQDEDTDEEEGAPAVHEMQLKVGGREKAEKKEKKKKGTGAGQMGHGVRFLLEGQ